MKAVKSIFDKSYIVESQAIAAGAKEWPQGIPTDVDLTYDEATRKYRFIKLATNEAIVGASRLIQAFVDCAKAQKAEERVPGYCFCPECGINLQNGVGEHMQDVNGTPIRHKKYEYACLACGTEFGPALNRGDAMANASMGVAGSRPRLSSCEGPTKKVWHIADSMPKASRKDVMAECVAQGIAYGTARTQYQAWFKASQEISREDVRRPYEKA